MKTPVAFLALSSLIAIGCTSPAPGVTEVAALDQPALITASGCHPDSMLGMRREGTLVTPTDVNVQVQNASIELHTGAKNLIDSAELTVADTDLPPSKELPEGLKLRAQKLVLPHPVVATIVSKTADDLVLTAETQLRYSASMVLADGTLYKLGDSFTESSTVTIHVSRDASGAVTITADATPKSACWMLNDLITITGCSLYVESSAAVTAIK